MRTTRRSTLAALGGTIALSTTAGCLGGSGGGSFPSDCDGTEVETVNSLPRPALGPEDASVTVDVFEDFACGHCATFTNDVYPQIESTYIEPGEIRYRYFDYPIPVDENWSWRAASAARAVQDRTDAETFFSFAKGIYEQQSRLIEDGYQFIREVADDNGVDGCTVATAAKEEAYREVVEADKQTGDDRGVPGTPAVFVDGELLENYAWDTVSAAIDGQLADTN
ncbi:thioredoxin domain-containing protein [Natrinema hispanicum]|uniref:Protein-disulfide isomerase n=1 Tax=Natrinema hispanicum TaxID=392421 RepID=A0A1G6RV57_9EURY|nr:thioredoxin domain-containing protein [Natrinema hispanicum]SDD08331.1 Protein-disulfide isomerase [Natrinema hispanicum]SET76891.1 Protein-disulfide isomerase [Natrinema hispanicum]